MTIDMLYWAWSGNPTYACWIGKCAKNEDTVRYRCHACRWMGSMRFTLGAILEVLKHCRYAATVAYLPASSSSPASHDSEMAVSPRVSFFSHAL